MNNMKYNLIKSSKKTVGDYLQNLDSNELLSIYTSSFSYDLKVPGLMKKIQHELTKRNVTAQPVLF